MPEVKQTFYGKDILEYVTQVFPKIWLKGRCQPLFIEIKQVILKDFEVIPKLDICILSFKWKLLSSS